MPNRRQFKNDEEYRAWYRNYREKNRKRLADYNREYNYSWRLSNGTEKDNVRRKLLYHVQNGNIKRGKCEICAETKDIEGHHFDYSKPLDVIWLCTVHHKAVHMND